MNTFLSKALPLGMLSLILSACVAPPSRAGVAAATAVAPASVTPSSLTVMVHDSFDIGEDLLKQFELTNNAKVTILKSGDAGAMLNKAILSKGAPLADVIFGIDNAFLSKALAAELVEPYAAPALANIPAEFKLDVKNGFLPVDYGYVSLNFDETYSDKALVAPITLRELAEPKWSKRLAVQNPATSSPGMAFLLITIAAFPEGSDYTWQQFWADLKKNQIQVSAGWSDAYYKDFSGSSGKGPYPLVVSYATSPAAELFYSEGKLKQPPTINVDVGAFAQVEFVGIMKGSKNRVLAEKWVDFMLSADFQKDFPTRMWVYPVLKDVVPPDVFTQYAPLPKQVFSLSPAQIDANRDKWVQTWTNIVLK